jgi:hypothetical protein
MSIVACFYEPETGLIELYLGEYRGLSGYDTSTVIKIRYKGIETDIKDRNYQITQYYDMTNDHVMYDIKHRTYNTETYKIDEFYIINTNIIIRIMKMIDIPDEGMINIDLNGLSIMEFAFLNEQIYRDAIRVFKMVFAEIQEQHLNSVNMANFTLPNNIQGSIGTFLTGQNGSITQQRTMVQQQQEQVHAQQMREGLNQRGRRRRTSFYQNGGQHKSRKLYKLHKLYKSHKSRKSRKSRKSCKK